MKFHDVKGRGEALFSLILVLFSAAAFWLSYGISGFGGLTTAGVFPMLASAAMLVSASVVLSEALRRGSPDGAKENATTERGAGKIFSRDLLIVVAMVSTYVAVMPYLGFVVSSALFLFAAFFYLWRKGVVASLAITALSITVIYVVFRLGFQVVLPGGTWLRSIF